MNQKEKISRSRKNGSVLLPSEPEYSGGFQNAECDFMDVEIGRINGQVRRFPVKIMPFIHEMFQHGLGIGLLVHLEIRWYRMFTSVWSQTTNPSFFSSSRFSGLIMMPPPVEIMRLCAAAV